MTYVVAAGDLDKDGHVDLVVASPSNGSIGVLLGSATGFGPVAQVSPPTNVGTGLLVADFNNDKNLDVLTYGSVDFAVLPGDGHGGLGAPITGSANPVAAEQLLAANVDHDQTLDVVGVYVDGQNNWWVFTAIGNGDGTFHAGSKVSLPQTAGGLAVGDFDGDGNTDAVVYEETKQSDGTWGTGTIAFFAGDGTGMLAAGPVTMDPVTGGAATNGVSPNNFASGDFDGDGKLDLAILEAQGIEIVRGDGTGAFSHALFRTTGSRLPGFAAGDLAGDGRPSLFYAFDGETYGTGEMLDLCK